MVGLLAIVLEGDVLELEGFVGGPGSYISAQSKVKDAVILGAFEMVTSMTWSP